MFAFSQKKDIEIIEISQSTLQHISYIELDNSSIFPCNGMIFHNKGEAIVIDTPPDSASSIRLINYIENELKLKIIAIVPSHFHRDCLGGLKQFHNKGIKSYAHSKTIGMAISDSLEIPQHPIDDLHEFQIDDKKILLKYYGEGHTSDNIVAFVPEENILFGGCLIKSIGAGKGNLADANLDEWPKTVKKIKKEYPELITVIPGHGKSGGIDLLDYTIQLFEN